jgi:hypothetical protein
VIDSQSVKADAVVGSGSVVVDTLGLLLAVMVTAADVGDRAAAQLLLTQVTAAHHLLALVWADGGYTGSLVEQCLAALALVLAIVKRSDDMRGSIEKRLRSLPGAEGVRARALSQVNMTGRTRSVFADFYRGDDSLYEHIIVKGRAPGAAGEIVADPAFLTQRGLKLGDRVTLELNVRRITVTVVGQVIEGNARALDATWETLAHLAPDAHATEYTVRLAPGAEAVAAGDSAAPVAERAGRGRG